MNPPRLRMHALLALGLAALAAGPAHAGNLFPVRGISIDDIEVVEIGDPIFVYTFTLELEPGWALLTREPGEAFNPANDGITIFDIDFLATNDGQPTGFTGRTAGLDLEYYFLGQPVYGPIVAPIGGAPVDIAVEVADRTGMTLRPFEAETLSIAPASQVRFAYQWRATRLNADGSFGEQETGFNVFVIPEPSSMALVALGVGLVGTAAYRRRRKAA